ncbi:MAG: STM3941 family protein [Gordonia sp. (in: high G+C Gram-positive bacteria)]|uniref:STM3941 family protein n=1 Tax=Gordonia sp. (in: high G+C Gram-positive bacteria) TaxID=84139 RepID=UPI0039E4AC55
MTQPTFTAIDRITPKALLVYLVGPWAFVAVGLLMLEEGDDEPGGAFISWLCIAFFGLCGLLGIWALIRRRIVLQVSRTGLAGEEGLWRKWYVPWAQVTSVYSHTQVVKQRIGSTKQHYIVVVTTDPATATSWERRASGNLLDVPPESAFHAAAWSPGVKESITEALVAIADVAPVHVTVEDRHQ